MSVPANFFDTYDVVASPADDTETVIAILGGVGELVPGLAVHLDACVFIGIDAQATDCLLAVRRESLTGDQVGVPQGLGGITPGSFGGFQVAVQVVDTPGDFAGAIYVLTAQCTNADSLSTVLGLGFHARVS